ncbi:MAG: hypothetical protein WB755_08895 [Terriglobales bacterium]
MIYIPVVSIDNSIFGGNMLYRLRLPYGSPSDACQASTPHETGLPPTPTLDKLPESLILHFSKEIYNLASSKVVTVRSKTD